MEVQVSRGFAERVRAVDPENIGGCYAPLPTLLVSSRGTVVAKTVADSWAKGTFASPVDSLEHHFAKHGRGRTRQRYTFDALRFFDEHKDEAQWGRWNPDWSESFRIKIGSQGGYFTPGGRILSYWDDYGSCEATV